MFDILYSNPFVIFIIGAVLIYYSSELLISNSITISNRFNIPKFIIGGTIIALGTSLPEIVVSVLANIKGNSNIAIGNIVGSNIANLGLVLGLSLCFKSIDINKKNYEYLYNVASLVFITFIFYFTLRCGHISYIHACIFIILYIIYFFIYIKYFNNEYEIDSLKSDINIVSNFIKLIFGMVLIYYGSQFFIDGAIGIASKIGVNDISIGLTIVAIGTSAPELIVSLNALRKNESMLALGNVFGSNIANIVFAGGISSLVKNIHINYDEIFIFSNIMLLLTVLLLVIIISSRKIYKIFSLIFISVYIIFIYINFYNY